MRLLRSISFLLLFAALPSAALAGLVDRSACVVLGQATMIVNQPNRGGAVAANTLKSPSKIAVDIATNRVFVADTYNNRVLCWRSLNALTNGKNAEFVLGQANFTSNGDNRGGAPTNGTLSLPGGIMLDGSGNLWVADTGNHRVLRYNTVTLTNGMAANLVLGQVDFTHNSANRGGAAAAGTLSSPSSVAADAAGNIWVADTGNNRVLRFNAGGLSNGAGAAMVLGQSDFVSYQANRNGSVDINTLAAPRDVTVDGDGNLWVADSDNNRLLRYSSASLFSGADAAAVLGQSDFVSNQPNRNGPVTANSLFSPHGVSVDTRGDVWVADRGNNRILKYAARDLANGGDAEYVLGQPDLTHGEINQGGTVSALTLYGPQDVAADTLGNIWVADRDNQRVLEYYTLRITSMTPLAAFNTSAVNVTNISGHDFVPESTVKLVKAGESDLPAASVNVHSLNAISCVFDIANKATGYWDLVISTGGAGALSVTLPNAFTVNPTRVTSITPNSAYNSGPVSVTNLSGAGFVAGSTVKLVRDGEADIPATGVVFVNAGLLRCSFDLAGRAVGNWDVVVSSGGPGSVSGTLVSGFAVKPMAVSSISLNYGYNTGATGNVSLLGVGFVAGSTVKLTKTGQPDIDAVSANVLTSTAAVCKFNLTAQATGQWNLVLSTGGPGSVTATTVNGYTIRPMSLTAINPASAYNTGPVTITSLTGAGFVAGSQVRLVKSGEADIPASNVVVVSSSVISCKFNLWKESTGQWDIVVSTDGLEAALAGGFAVKPIALTSVTPTLGYNTGPAAMSAIVGAGFVSGTAISLQRSGQPSIPATSVTMVNSNKFMCTFNLTGAAVGAWDVAVATDTLAAVLPGGFTVAPMAVTSVTPGSGYNTAAVRITKIGGLGFTSNAEVRLVRAGEEDIVASALTLTGTTAIACTVDLAGKATGAWDVMVTTGGSEGWLSAAKAGAFTINPMTVESIAPDYGCNTSIVTIGALKGTGFVNGTTVRIAREGEPEIAATNVVVTAGNSIACKLNLAGAATGTWDLIVSTGGAGSVTVVKPACFTVRPMVLFSVAPNSASNTGIVSITKLAGEGFVAGSKALLVKAGEADIAGTNVTVTSSSTINCKFNLNGAATGTWDIVLSTGGPGSISATLPACFSVRPLLSTSITPAAGYNTGTVNITRLAGDGFISGMTVRLVRDGEPEIQATNTVVSNATTATCKFNLAGAATGLWSVYVETSTVSDTLPDAFEVLPMAADSISPETGSNSGPVTATVRGGGFVTGTTMKLVKDGETAIAATGVAVTSAAITGKFDLRERANGDWDVVVSTGGAGSLSASIPAGFRISSMTVNSVSPESGCNTSLLTGIRLNGDGFVAGSTVRFLRSGEADIAATAVTVSSSKLITCTADLRGKAIGYWDVIVATATLNAVLPSGFNIRPMLVNSVNPPSGCNTAKISVTDILGDGFIAGSRVKLMKTGETDIPATAVTVYSPSRIACTFDLTSQATGYWDLVVSSGSYNAALAAGFLVEPMQVAALNPSSAYNTGSVTVNPLSGKGFVSGSVVRLSKAGEADIPATNVVVVTSAAITCRFDLRGAATGYWDVTVSTGGAGSLNATRAGAMLVKPISAALVVPNIASNTGPVPFELSGEGFVAGTTVRLTRSGEPDIAATGVSVANAARITGSFDLTDKTTGWWNVTVATGALTATLNNGFFVNAIVRIDSITPDWGYNTAALEISDLAGQSFVEGAMVKMTQAGSMDIAADSVTVVDAGHITCRFDLVGAATGYWNVMLICGSSSVNLFNGIFVRPMAVSSLTPSSQYNTGTVDTASIAGEGFVEGVTARLTRAGRPDIPAENLVLVSPAEIACSLDTLGGATGYWNLVVSTGSVDAVYPDAFLIKPMRAASITPSQASNTGMFDINAITGEGFIPACGVRLRKSGQPDIAAVAVNVVDPNTISCRFDLAGAATGLWNVVVSSEGAGAVEALLPDSFTVRPMLIDTVSPAYGCNTGTVAVTIDGTDLVSGSTVRLTRAGESDVPSFAVTHVDPTRITCGFDLAGVATGFWNVAIASGVLTTALTNGFEVKPLSIYSLSPAVGYNTGPAAVNSLNGDGFTPGTTVKLARSGESDIPASSVAVLSSTRIACSFDLRGVTAGYWDVIVATGSHTGMLLHGYHVQPMSISGPLGACNTGPAAVQIAGAGFVSGSTVRITKAGQTPIDGQEVTVTGPDSISCRFELHGAATGAWNIVVATDTLSATLLNGFTVRPLKINGITPSVGHNSGPMTVTALSGDGFAAGTTVKLTRDGEADIPAQDLVIVDTGTITCTFDVTGAASGLWNVAAQTGTVTAQLIGGLTVKPMQINALTPAVVYNVGQSDICINGEGFRPGSAATFRKAARPDIIPESVTVLTSTAILCRVNLTALTTGPWEASVTVNSFSASLADALLIKPMAVTSVTPSSQFNSCHAASFAITGEGLVPGTTAAFIRAGEPDRLLTGLAVTSSTGAVCQADLAGAATGYWDLLFSTGPVSAVRINALLVQPMSIVSILPTSGINTGGVSMELAGSGFVNGATVRLERAGQPDIPGAAATVYDASRISADFNLTAAATGYWDVVVATGSVRALFPSGFLVEPMSIAGASPDAGFATAETCATTVYGAGFVPGAAVLLRRGGVADIPASSVSFAGAGALNCVFDLRGRTTGYWTLVVATGAVTAQLPNGFTIRPMAINGINPASGSNTTIVNITHLGGEGFTAGTTVLLRRDGCSDIPGENTVVESGSKITCRFDLNSRATGYWDIVAATGSVTAVLPEGFLVTPMEIISLSPAYGYVTGAGASLTVHGRGFTPTTAAKLIRAGEADIPASSLTVEDAATIRCTFPLRDRTTGFWSLYADDGIVNARLDNGFEIRPMSAEAITPSSGNNNGPVNITDIAGEGFVEGCTVRLTRSGETAIAGDMVTVASYQRIACMFDLENRATDFWNVVITTGAYTVTLPAAFEIIVTMSAHEAIDHRRDAVIIIKPVTGDIRVDIPAETFSQDVTMTVSTAPVVAPPYTQPLVLTGIGMEMYNNLRIQPSGNMTVTVHYRPQDIAGLDEAKLVLGRYDEDHARWVTLPSRVYTAERKVVATTNHLSRFALFQIMPSGSLDDLNVYPNPFYPARHTQGMTFDHLTAEAEIQIFTINGELVRDLAYDSRDGRAVWDGRNGGGRNVARGIYIAVIRGPSGTKKLKLAVEK